MSQDCPVKTILAIVGYAANAGVPPPELLHAAGLDPTLLADPDAYLLRSQETRVWDAAARLTGDPDFGLHLGEWVAGAAEDVFDVLTFAVRSCPTLGAAYRLVGRYLRLVHEGIYLSLEEEGDVARLVHGHSPEQIGPRHPVEGMLALALSLGRRGVGAEFVPQSVCFAHARPERVSEQERVFLAPVRYGCPRNELVLDRALLARPQRQADPRLLTMLDHQLATLLSGLPVTRRVRDVVTRSMLDELSEREPVIATIAAKLHMSARSLQRRLQGEGTSFAEVLSDLRRDRALHYLKDRRVSIGEVAFLLGFRDATAFHRAFKRWTGSTPARYRSDVVSGEPTPPRR